MSIKKITLEEAISYVPAKRNSLFYLLSGESKNFRFIGGFNSFIPLRMHTLETNNSGYIKYETRFCMDHECIHCLSGIESKVCLYLPIYECDFTGKILVQEEKIWKLPYLSIYNHFKELPDDVKHEINKNFVFHVSREENKYDFKFSYIFSNYNNLKEVEYLPNHFLNILIDMYGKDNIKKVVDNPIINTIGNKSKNNYHNNNNNVSSNIEYSDAHTIPIYDQTQNQKYNYKRK